MPRLLFLEASPRKGRSASTEVAQHFVEQYRANHPNAFVDHLDLWAKPLPEFDQQMLDAKYAVMQGQSFSAAQKAAWGTLEQLIDRFKAADHYLLSVPMWNFGIPYKLKHYLDLIMQPGLTFGFTAERGYFGLLEQKKALVVYASGGDYPVGSPAEAMDFQSRYLAFALRFLGVEQQYELRAAPTLARGADGAEAAKTAAKAKALEFASLF